jgi:hypothetical protein
MKKYILGVSLVIFTLLAVAFCSQNNTGPVVPPNYGIFNEATVKDPNWTYQVSPLSVILSVVFFETIFVPVYCIGWELYEPVRHK